MGQTGRRDDACTMTSRAGGRLREKRNEKSGEVIRPKHVRAELEIVSVFAKEMDRGLHDSSDIEM